MTELFRDFDFELLDDPTFREDSVREELIVPLLSALGYSPSPPNRIIRSQRLQHPYVFIGTAKKPISIVPDYLLQREGENAWVLDAKGPNETIDSGKNVEQAYSYAMHKDVRVPVYALCNGHQLVVFHVSHWPAIINVALQDVVTVWPMLVALLGTKGAWPDGRRPGFLPDMGLSLRKAGLIYDEHGQKLYHLFTEFPVEHVVKLEDTLFSITGRYRAHDSAYMLTFDFGPEEYRHLLSELHPTVSERIRSKLSRQPFWIDLQGGDVPFVTVDAELGDEVNTNENESYCPFIAKEFIAEPSDLASAPTNERHSSNKQAQSRDAARD